VLKVFFEGINIVLFIPYARPGGISYDDYTEIVKKAFSKIDIQVEGIHKSKDTHIAIKKAEAIFTGGGNTFELVNQLYKKDILINLKHAINNGTRYLGTSAGSNICGISMMNTNDMPIVYPPSFLTLGSIPFNINAHYLDPLECSKHMGESRETRIKEYHFFNETPVLGLREGSWLEVSDDKIILKGNLTARLFQQNKKSVELESGVAVLIN
jgi:dipeptidase E